MLPVTVLVGASTEERLQVLPMDADPGECSVQRRTPRGELADGASQASDGGTQEG